jgi:hypothetical protein
VHDALDEQGRCAPHLTRRNSALDVPANTAQHISAELIFVEACAVELEFGRIPLQIVVFECVLAVEEQLVHVPEPALECGGLGRGSRCQGVRVDLCEGKMPESEADVAVSLLDVFDLSKRLPRVRAFVIAVLEDQTTG